MTKLKYFMWGFQQHFQVCAEEFAKQVFGLLDDNLRPRVFLIGVRQVERPHSHPVCVEPEDCGYHPDLFDEVEDRAQAVLKSPSDTVWIHPNEYVANQFAELDRRSSIARAVFDIVSQNTDVSRFVTFCSGATPVENYLVCVLLQLDRSAYEQWKTLKKTVDEQHRVHISLIEAATSEYLDFCANEMSKPEPGKSLVVRKDAEEIIRAAGKLFMYKASNVGGNFRGLHSLYDACNVVSSLKYEGTDGIGQMIIAKAGHPSVLPSFQLKSPVKLSDFRAARKLLELASGQMYLISDSEQVHSLGQLDPSYDVTREDLFEVRFVKHHTWELWHGRSPLMRVTYGQPRLPQQRFSVEKLGNTFRRVMKDACKDTEHLVALVRAATEQRHGTMLVVSPKAAAEAERLKRQALVVKPFRMEPDLLRLVTRIDGSLLLNPHGECVAIGVILDGVASAKGTSGRGARYNSAMHYVEGNKGTIAVVISEDGMIDIIPDLLPQMKRSNLDSRMDLLRQIAETGMTSEKEFRELMNWFDEHRFYVPPSECQQINRLWKDPTNKLPREVWRRVYKDFVPHADLDDAYFV